MSLYRFILVLAALIIALSPINAQESKEQNVVIDELNVDVRVDVKNGRATRIKETSNYTLSATKSDELAVLVQYYDNDAITIDKASGQGGKPIYASAETPSIFYSGSKICGVPVQLKAGKTGKATIERTFVKPQFFIGATPLESYPIKKYVFTLHVPKTLGMDVRILEHNLPEGVHIIESEAKEELLYTLTLENIPSISQLTTSMAPDIRQWWPTVDINVCFANTDELYSYLSGMLEDEDSNHSSISEITGTVTAGLTTDIDKVEAIASWVHQNIRYIAIEHGEWGHRPDRAEEVLRKRFADCKGSANLIRAMLRAAGIDGRRVWIGTRNSMSAPWSETAALHSGNHMIAAAVLQDTTLFIDGTVKFAPRGFLPYDDAGMEVIIEDGSNYILTHTPRTDTKSNILNYTADFSIDGKNLVGDAEIDLGGANHIEIQNTLSLLTAGKRQSMLTQLMCFHRKGMTVADPTIIAEDFDTGHTLLKGSVNDANGVRIADGGAKLYVSLLPLRFFDYATFSGKSRRAPFDFGAPHHFTSEIRLTIPEGYNVADLPETLNTTSPWFQGSVDYSIEPDGKVLCKAELHTIATEGSGDSLEEWNKSVRSVSKISNTPLILIKSEP